jgi:hypothetical protein
MPKTIILAIFTLCLAVSALVTNLVSPYPTGVDSAVSVTTPTPSRSPLRVPVRSPVMEASKTTNSNAI